MRELRLVGIGMGHPDHLTFAGAAALRGAGAILIPRKETAPALAALRRTICARHAPDVPLVEVDLPRRDASGAYLDGVVDWHDAVAQAWAVAVAGGPEAVALPIWGDPSLYDSALRIAERLRPAPRVQVVPGITALQALCAAHAIPFNDIGAPVTVTTGRRLRAEGWPVGATSVAVMLDQGGAFAGVTGAEIWWGAYLGLPEEVLCHGSLPEVAAEILAVRAAARARHGWIMDTYLMRRG